MNSEPLLLSPGQIIRPPISTNYAVDLMKKLYGMTVTSIKELNGYDDKNYHVTCAASHSNPHIECVHQHGYVLKVMNSLDSKRTMVIEAQTELLLFLNLRGIACSLPMKNLKGTFYHLESFSENREDRYAVRLLVYHPGELLLHVPITTGLLRSVGRHAAEVDRILLDFTHPGYENHRTLWVLTSLPQLRKFTYVLNNILDRELVHDVIVAFEDEVFQVVPQLEQGIIHGDLNEQNLIISSNHIDVAALIDFGDSQINPLVFELAILLCYMLLQAGDIAMGKCVIEGYESVRKLKTMEKRILKILVCARLCQSLVMGTYSHIHDQQNDYVLSTQKSGWMLLKKLWPMRHDEVLQAWGLVDS